MFKSSGSLSKTLYGIGPNYSELMNPEYVSLIHYSFSFRFSEYLDALYFCEEMKFSDEIVSLEIFGFRDISP